MKAMYKKAVTAKDLPADWQEEGQFLPDEQLNVWVEPNDPELAAATTMAYLMDLVSMRAEQRGLTQEKLDTILYEE